MDVFKVIFVIWTFENLDIWTFKSKQQNVLKASKSLNLQKSF